MPSPGCEHAYPIPRVAADLRLRESLLWNQNRHNTAVLTYTRQASKNQSLFVHVGGYTETDPSGVFVTQQLATAWSNQMGLFGADSVVRHRYLHNTQQTQKKNIHDFSGIRTRNPIPRVPADLRLRASLQ